MRTSLLILLIAWSYVGCAAPGPPPSAAPPLRLTVSFEPADRAALLARWSAAGRPPGVQIEFADARALSVAATLALGRAGFGVVYGGEVARVRDVPGLRVGRAPGWDRGWTLWVEDRGSWVVDPAFRRWLAAALTPGDWPELLFDGQAVAVARDDLALPRRPFDDRTRPTLTLAAPEPGAATRIASRIRAELDSRGVQLDRAATDRASLRVLVRRDGSDDALDDLRDTLEAIGPRARPWLERLERLEAAAVGRTMRDEAAATLERELVEAGQLIPLVRELAWSVRAESAGPVRAGRYAELRFGELTAR